MIFIKKCFIIALSGEKCIKVERSGDFSQIPQSFPQPCGAVNFTHQNDNEKEVTGMMLYGRFEHNIDAKGRVFVSVTLREKLD